MGVGRGVGWGVGRPRQAGKIIFSREDGNAVCLHAWQPQVSAFSARRIVVIFNRAVMN